MPKDRYDLKFKMDALIMLRDSGLSVKEIARQLKVTDTTLRAWRNRYYNEVFKTPNEVKRESEQIMTTVKKNVIERYNDLLMQTADRFEYLIPRTNSIDALQKAALTIAKLAGLFNEKSGVLDVPQDMSPITFFQQINQQYINKYIKKENDETKSDTIPGDTEE